MRYYIPCAKNKINNQRVQEQKLGNSKGYTNRAEALLVAQALCDKLEKRQSGDWTPFVKTVNK